MPQNSRLPGLTTSVPDPSAGARVASGPHHAREYGPDGLFLHGPQLAQPHWVRLIPDATEPPTTLPPSVVRARMAAVKADRKRILSRHARFLAAIQGQPVGRNRSRAA